MSFYLAAGTLFIATYLYESAPEAPAMLDHQILSLKSVDREVMGMEKVEEVTSPQEDASVPSPNDYSCLLTYSNSANYCLEYGHPYRHIG